MSGFRIVRRSEWGFDGWAGTPYSIDERAYRTEFFVHYQGATPCLSRTGVSVPRSIHAFHKSRGWKGIGYGHVVDSTGTIFEGRGFGLVGSHCPDHNRSGYSVQLHLGGNEKPTAAQRAAGRWLYDEACRRSGRTLAMRGHRDGFGTECPGDHTYSWVRAGMPVLMGSGGGAGANPTGGVAGGGSTFEEDDMNLDDKVTLTDAERKTWGVDGDVTVRDLLTAVIPARQYGYRAARDAAATLEVVRAIAAAGRPLSDAEIEAAAARGTEKVLDERIADAKTYLEVKP